MLNEIEYPFFFLRRKWRRILHTFPIILKALALIRHKKKNNKQTQKHITPSSHTINHYI